MKDLIIETLKKVEQIAYEQLIKSCLESFFKSCSEDFEYWESEENFKDECNNNTIEFLEDGTKFCIND